MKLIKTLSIMSAAAVILLSGCGTQTSDLTTTAPSVTNITSPVPKVIVPPKPKPIVYPTLSLGSTKPAVIAVQQMLAELGYLPISFTGTIAKNPNKPSSGTFTWKYTSMPSILKNQWAQGDYNQMTRGAVMTFQEVNNLSIDGVVGPNTWKVLQEAVKNQTKNPYGYTYIYVSKGSPEMLTVWKNGAKVLTSRVNTGIRGATTPNGTWPIYERYTSQTMKGTMPNGSKYVDPGIPWVNYFYLGDAVHGYPRASYGYPQSNGCAELPISTAKEVYQIVHYGTLVTVTS